MITRIENIYIYTGLTPTGGNDSATAVEWLDSNNIAYTNLWYGDKEQHQEVLGAINTWNVGEVSDFPFVIYDEIDDEGLSTRRGLIGLDAILNSNLVELVALST
jgi:hypothetical protein